MLISNKVSFDCKHVALFLHLCYSGFNSCRLKLIITSNASACSKTSGILQSQITMLHIVVLTEIHSFL